MKKLLALTLFMAIMFNGLLAQDTKRNWIGVNASMQTGTLIRFGGSAGGAGYHTKMCFLFGIGYLRVINDKLDLESGIEYSSRSFTLYYVDDLGQTVNIEGTQRVNLLTIPINLRIKFRKQFFLTTGILYDQELSMEESRTIDEQTGIGITFKFGRDFRISENTILYVAPELIVHNIVPFHPEHMQQNLTEVGLRMSYKFGF